MEKFNQYTNPPYKDGSVHLHIYDPIKNFSQEEPMKENKIIDNDFTLDGGGYELFPEKIKKAAEVLQNEIGLTIDPNKLFDASSDIDNAYQGICKEIMQAVERRYDSQALNLILFALGRKFGGKLNEDISKKRKELGMPMKPMSYANYSDEELDQKILAYCKENELDYHSSEGYKSAMMAVLDPIEKGINLMKEKAKPERGPRSYSELEAFPLETRIKNYCKENDLDYNTSEGYKKALLKVARPWEV